MKLIHLLKSIPSRIESAYYSEAKIENEKRKAIAEKRKQQIQQIKAKKHGSN